jgi:acyl-[acyl carrier protein]--UDP-N-acetylglucosamine O-acyltransferase
VVRGPCIISDHARVSGHARVGAGVVLQGRAQVYEKARVSGEGVPTVIGGSVHVRGTARVTKGRHTHVGRGHVIDSP